MKNKKIILIVLALVFGLSLTLAACEEKPQECQHNYVDGKCTVCGEIDPSHTHTYDKGVCTICGAEDPNYKEAQELVLPTDLPKTAAETTLLLHYYREKADDYLEWDFWIWKKGGNGNGYPMTYQDSFGGIAVVKLSVLDATTSDTIGIIPRLGNWEEKDCSVDRMLELNSCEVDENNYIHIYLTEGDENLYKSAAEMGNYVSAKFITYQRMEFEARQPILSVTLLDEEKELVTIDGKSAKDVFYNIPTDLAIDPIATLTAKLTLEGGIVRTVDIDTRILLTTNDFNKTYYYDGELGAIYSAQETKFRVWSPVSTKILLNIYNTGHQTETPATYEMVKGDKGVFEYSLSDKDYAGKYYTYTVYNKSYPDGAEIVDPYAKSAGLNGVRGMIVDFSQTNPTGWDSVSPINYDRKELTVWETHVADVTSSATWNGTAENSKKFLGLIESGTTYTKGEVTVSTGFDHIKELGVNAVQLVPIFDQANDESNMTFNWGYNPLNYNVLEGGYSSDATDGYARIREFKQVVQAFNGEGINIIMDVVYNHVNAAIGSNFDVLMPGYYFRYDMNGSLSNGSGCGNETASEMLMFRKFMIDSVCFWAKEYKLGGFRFDLMGLHDIETMNLLTAELQKINPDIVVYGEPWKGGDSTLPQNQQAVQSNGSKYVGYGQFNDQMRDALIKGGMKGKEELGWITNTSSVSGADVSTIKNGLQGITSTGIKDPNKTVNYVTCHDNYTLVDRFAAAGITDADVMKKMAVLANSIVFTSNGTSFMLAGEEFLRTKGGDHNSYQSSYKVNELNYELKVDNYDVFQNYQKLIAFKQTCAGLHLEQSEIAENYTITMLGNNAVIRIDITAGDKTYIVLHANGTVKNVTVDLSGYSLYLDTLNTENLELTAETAIQPFQTLIVEK